MSFARSGTALRSKRLYLSLVAGFRWLLSGHAGGEMRLRVESGLYFNVPGRALPDLTSS